MSLYDIESWLEADEDDPGYHIKTEEDNADSVTGVLDISEEDEDEDIINSHPKFKASEVKHHLNFGTEYVQK